MTKKKSNPEITVFECQVLRSIKCSSEIALEVKKATAILMLAKGQRVCVTAKEVSVTEKIVFKWRQAFKERRLSSIREDLPSERDDSGCAGDIVLSRYGGEHFDLWDDELKSYRFLDTSARGLIIEQYGPLRWIRDHIDISPWLSLYSPKGRGPTTIRNNLMLSILMMREGASLMNILRGLQTNPSLRFAVGAAAGEKINVSRSNYFLFQSRITEYFERTGVHLIDKTFAQLVEIMAPDMGFTLHGAPDGYILSTRTDSHPVAMFAAHRSRCGITYKCNQDAVNLLKSLNFEHLVPQRLYHYFEKDDENRVIYHNKDKIISKMQTLLEESLLIRSIMSSEEWHGFSEYQHLVRCIKNQGIEDPETGTIVPRDNKEIQGSSLQTPVDPEATCLKKNGKVFQGNVGCNTEAYDQDGHSLVIWSDFGNNLVSDTEFQLRQMLARGEDASAEINVSDGAFFSMELYREGLNRAFFMNPTALTGTLTNSLFALFELAPDGQSVLRCPRGAEPISQDPPKDNGVINAKFAHSDCKDCKFAKTCPRTEQVRANKVEISLDMVDRAEIILSMTGVDYSAISRARNGAESVPSILNNQFHVQNIRSFRGEVRRLMYFAAVICLNAYKYSKYKNDVGSVLFASPARVAQAA